MDTIDFKENTERHSKEIIKLLKNKGREFPNMNQYSISLDPTVVMAGIVPKNDQINANDLVKLNKILKIFNTPEVCLNNSLNLTNMLKNNLFHNPDNDNKVRKNPFDCNPNNNYKSLQNNAVGNSKGPIAEIPESNDQFSSNTTTGFISARQELNAKNFKQNDSAIKSTSTPVASSSSKAHPLFSYAASKKSLGARRTGRSNFVPPIRKNENPSENNAESNNGPVDERLLNVDPKMIEMIMNEIMHKFKNINWNDIAGLDYAKSTIKEAVVWPMLRPDIFTGLRRPPRGILLFGPPGTGKTLIGKCIASQSKSTFFSISASSLTSKWVGDGEKMVRALFAVAAVNQPSVVFIDEIDSLLCQRSESEHESSRRIKTEFLVQLDGAATSEEERILIVGATNRPQELDEAARRRLVRRLYIPLPDLSARAQILNNLLKTVFNNLTDEEIQQISKITEGYSGADMETLCREASLEPIRSINAEDMEHFEINNVRPVNLQDFYSGIKRVRPSVSQNDIKAYLEWNNTYGAGNLNC